jgi:hypothetical protein
MKAIDEAFCPSKILGIAKPESMNDTESIFQILDHGTVNYLHWTPVNFPWHTVYNSMPLVNYSNTYFCRQVMVDADGRNCLHNAIQSRNEISTFRSRFL